MSESKVYSVYVAEFPFFEKKAAKLRPVIVVSPPSRKYRLVTIIPVSSVAEVEESDIGITNWASSGLLKESVARIHRMTTMLQADLKSELGSLHQEDMHAVKKALRLHLEL